MKEPTRWGMGNHQSLPGKAGMDQGLGIPRQESTGVCRRGGVGREGGGGDGVGEVG